MKLLFLIPVTAEYEQKKKDIISYLSRYLHPETALEFAQITEGFPSVESELQGMVNGCQVVKTVNSLDDSYDGVYINCFDDPGVYSCRELRKVPVIGPYQTSVHTASVLSDRIRIITTDKAGILTEDRKAAQLGITNSIMSIQPVNLAVRDIRTNHEDVVNSIVPICRKMVEEDRVNTICLGCTAMFYVVDELRKRLKEENIQVTIIEPMLNAIKFLENMAILGYNNYIPDIK